jgi:RNA polymerase sigma factor (sigma-70 family)
VAGKPRGRRIEEKSNPEDAETVALRRSTGPSRPEAVIAGQGEFAGFYAAHAAAITDFVAQRTRDRSWAPDITSETFATAYEHRHDFRGKTSAEERAWLLTIARTRLNQHYRRLEAERRIFAEAEGTHAASSGGLDPLVVERLSMALSQLPEEQRVVIVERVILERGYRAIAESHGVREQTVRARVSRGLRTLAQLLG